MKTNSKFLVFVHIRSLSFNEMKVVKYIPKLNKRVGYPNLFNIKYLGEFFLLDVRMWASLIQEGSQFFLLKSYPTEENFVKGRMHIFIHATINKIKFLLPLGCIHCLPLVLTPLETPSVLSL